MLSLYTSSISANVTIATECARVVAKATAWGDGSPPDVVWCYSGSAHPTLFIYTLLDQFQTVMDSNYLSSVYMAHAILNAWVGPATTDDASRSVVQQSKRQRHVPSTQPLLARHLVFIGLFVLFYSFAGFTLYVLLKVVVCALSDSLS